MDFPLTNFASLAHPPSHSMEAQTGGFFRLADVICHPFSTSSTPSELGLQVHPRHPLVNLGNSFELMIMVSA